jgi:hypothetical protein
LASRWLKERFGERGEGSGRSRPKEESLEETYERIKRKATTKEEYSDETPKEVAGESEPTTPEGVGLHQDVSATLQTNTTPQIKEFFSRGKGTSPLSPTPPMPSINLVISTINIYVNSTNSNPSSPTS